MFLKSLKGEQLICGNVNIDIIGATNHKYLNLTTSIGLNIFDEYPTRVTPQSKTCIEHINYKNTD